jgi:hypothetical protein
MLACHDWVLIMPCILVKFHKNIWWNTYNLVISSHFHDERSGEDKDIITIFSK